MFEENIYYEKIAFCLFFRKAHKRTKQLLLESYLEINRFLIN